MPTSKPEEAMNINYTINTHSNNNGSGNASRSILAMSKPAMMGVGFLALGTLAVGLFSWFRVPGLEEQIKELEAEIDRLESEIDVLENENDRYEELNQDLNETLQDLVMLNVELNETANDLEEQVAILNSTVVDLNDTKNDLEDEEQKLNQLNQDLIVTQLYLEAELNRLEILNQTWTETNQNLTASTNQLQLEVNDLQQTNDELVNVTESLNASVIELQEQNERFDAALENLQVVNQYFTATNQDLNDQIGQVQTALNNSITLSRTNTFSALYNFYNDATTQWSCRNNDLFGTAAFYNPLANQQSSVVEQSGEAALDNILLVIDERLLNFLCASVENFDRFMTYTSFNSSTISHEEGRQLISFDAIERAAQLYGSNAMQYYGLPNCGGGNSANCQISRDEWEAASFDCKNLNAPYTWTDPRLA